MSDTVEFMITAFCITGIMCMVVSTVALTTIVDHLSGINKSLNNKEDNNE